MQRVELVTRLIHWDAKWFVFEQRFESGGVVYAEAWIRGVLKHGRRTIPPAELMRAMGVESEPPEASPALRAWLESLEPTTGG